MIDTHLKKTIELIEYHEDTLNKLFRNKELRARVFDVAQRLTDKEEELEEATDYHLGHSGPHKRIEDCSYFKINNGNVDIRW